jgi:hypothetical protein
LFFIDSDTHSEEKQCNAKQRKTIVGRREAGPCRAFFLGMPGVNVMINVFCDFHQFSAKNRVFLQNQC